MAKEMPTIRQWATEEMAAAEQQGNNNNQTQANKTKWRKQVQHKAPWLATHLSALAHYTMLSQNEKVANTCK